MEKETKTLSSRFCLSEKIDRLCSLIDNVCDRIYRQKEILLGGLKLGTVEDVLIDSNQLPLNCYLQKVHRRFFALLKEVKQLKKKGRKLYKKISAIKKNWFGFLSKQEVKLAIALQAKVVM